MVTNFKMVVQYDGTKYDGWQKQGQNGSAKRENTIQGKLEFVLSKMTGEEIAVHGSGRTDAGVHAKEQVANFKTERKVTAQYVKDYLNEYLPEDIAVVSVEETDERFHARLNAKAKRYLYRINNSNVSNVFERKYVYQVLEPLNLEAMEEAVSYLMGKHDFKSFCSNKRMTKSSVRTLYEVDVEKIDNEIDFMFYGDGFLHNMVRIMVGTLIEIGLEKRRPEEIVSIFEAQDRSAAGFTAPGKGLTLIEVEY